MRSNLVTYILPVVLFNVIWGAVEFLVPVRYSEAGISVGVISILFAASSALSVLLDIPSGRLSDRIGRERLIAYSMAVSATALALLYFFASFPAFLAASLLVGIAYGLNWSPLLAFVGDRTRGNDHGNVFGDFFVLSALGEASAPLIIVFLLFYTNTAFPFLALAAVALFCMFVFLHLARRQSSLAKPEVGNAGAYFSYRNALAIVKKALPTNLFLFALGFFVAFFWQSVWFTEPLIGFYEDSLLDSALVVVAFSLPMILFSKPIGKFIDRFGEKKVFLSSIILVVVCFALFYASASLGAKIATVFAASVGVQGIWLVLDVLAVKTHTKEERGEFFGILETVRDTSYTLTPLFIGFTYKIIGLNGIFIVNSAIAVLLLLFGMRLFRKSAAIFVAQ